MPDFDSVFAGSEPLIGMIHLPPLPDYPDSPGIDALLEHALKDLSTLRNAGFDGVLIENEYDRPHRVRAAPATIDAMKIVTRAVVGEGAGMAIGCEILLNDPLASLAVAHESGADFIRTDYFIDAMTRPEYGEFDIDPASLLAYRRQLGADDVLILADIQVKYAEMIEPRPLAESARLASAAGADAIVVTGDASGDSPTVQHLDEATAGADLPVLIGSGLSGVNASLLAGHCTGAIVGTALMRDGAVDPAAARALKAAWTGA